MVSDRLKGHKDEGGRRDSRGLLEETGLTSSVQGKSLRMIPKTRVCLEMYQMEISTMEARNCGDGGDGEPML